MNQTAWITLAGFALTCFLVIGSGVYWAGQIDARIEAQDRRKDLRFEQVDRRIDSLSRPARGFRSWPCT